jgi:aerobic carbon-monoxide dehydrogenase medium subunit
MKAAPFAYVRASTPADVVRLMAQSGPDAVLIAGGQSLLASLAFRLSQPQVLIDIGRVDALRGVTLVGDMLRLGALTTHRELATSPLVEVHAPLLRQAAHHIAHPAIRNRGTIGGSLAYADPASELPACVIALDATIVIMGAAGERRVPAQAFFTGLFTTALAAGEFIVAVEVPTAAASGRKGTLYELARRSGDYAMAGVVITAKVDDRRLHAPRVVFFGLGDTAVVAAHAAAALDGAGDVAAAVGVLGKDLDPPEDQHGSTATKLHLAGVVLKRAVAELITRGGHPS